MNNNESSKSLILPSPGFLIEKVESEPLILSDLVTCYRLFKQDRHLGLVSPGLYKCNLGNQWCIDKIVREFSIEYKKILSMHNYRKQG